ncbi:MAG: hypothetical protein DDT21_02547 [Syntrophomonadaceae bacterium]|nr:hypothetical protein [Bacillota bacterium]
MGRCLTGVPFGEHRQKERECPHEKIGELGILLGEPIEKWCHHDSGYDNDGDYFICDHLYLRWGGKKYDRFYSPRFWDEGWSRETQECLKTSRVIEIALERQIPLEKAEKIAGQEFLADRRQKIEAAKKAKAEEIRQLRQRLAEPQTPEDQKRREELLELLGGAGFFSRTSSRPPIPVALPYFDERATVSEKEAEAIGMRRSYPHTGPFSCPFCGQKAKENEPCWDCLLRVTSDFTYEEIKEQVKSGWDPFRETWSDAVGRYWRLRQYQCQCGQWADSPICPQCEEKFERQQAGGRLLSATKKMVGKKVRLSCESWPVEVIDDLQSVRVEPNPEYWELQPCHKVELVFKTGTKARFICHFVKEEGSVVHITDFRWGYKTSIEVDIQIKEER